METDFKGKVPKTIEELISLPGVGRKTANVFLSELGISALGVDTHVSYISQKLGWTKHKNPHKIEHDLKLLVVDYLQLIRGRNLENRVQEVSEISQSLKNLARELNIPVLAISQLSRAVESRQAKIPQLADLRESGAIEQDADVVMFMYREDPDDLESIKLSIAKHRNGPLGEVDLRFVGERRRFYGIEKTRS